METNYIDDNSSAYTNQTDHNVTVLPIVETNVGPNLLDLNDDCLLAIFSSNLLTPLDICSLAETCQHFKRIIPHVSPRYFETEYAENWDDVGYKFVSRNHSESYTTQAGAERILKVLGSCFFTISLRRDDWLAINWVVEHCNGGALALLKLNEFIIKKSLAIELGSIFRQLLGLHITSSRLKSGINLFINCDSLVELKIVSVTGIDEIFNNTFPKLQQFTFMDGSYAGSAALTFIGRHKLLTTLILNTKYLYRLYEFAPTISSNCKKLEELTLLNFYSLHIALDFSDLEGPTKLRMLDVTLGIGYYSQVLALLHAFKSLEIVKLSSGLLQEETRCVLVAVSRLENLRELHLTNCSYKRTPWNVLSGLKKLCLINSFVLPIADLLDIISELSNLPELEIRTNTELSGQEFSSICKAVTQRPNVLTLKCWYGFGGIFLKHWNKNGKIKLIKLD